MRLAVAIVCTLCACGRIGFDQAGDGGFSADVPPAPNTPMVQTGTLTIQPGMFDDVVEIATVDPAHAMLTLAFASDITAPDDCMVAGQLIAPDKIRFTRDGSEGTVEVRWAVTVWAGLDVQRGTTPIDPLVERVTLSPPVPLDRSFALATTFQSGSEFNDDDMLQVTLTDLGSTLELAMFDQNNAGLTAEWQVVTIPTARVIHGSGVLIDSVVAISSNLPSAIDPARSLLVYSIVSGTNAPLEIRHRMIAGRIVTPTVLAFERLGGMGTVEVTYSVVELAQGRVQHGQVSFADGDPSLTTPLQTVDPAVAFPYGGAYGGTGGMTADAGPGPGTAFAVGTVSPGSIEIRRRGTGTPATIPWSVVELVR